MLEAEPSDRSNRSEQFRTDTLQGVQRRAMMAEDDYYNFLLDSAGNADRFMDDY